MRSKWKMTFAVMAILLGAATVSASGTAAPLRFDGRFGDFHGRDFRTFSRIEREQWLGGHWIHAWHDGRFGWWWSVGPYWYFYTEPVYPYPVYVPPLVAAPPAQPSPAIWYYCENPAGYYPYVSACNAPWRQVPATPPPAPQAG